VGLNHPEQGPDGLTDAPSFSRQIVFDAAPDPQTWHVLIDNKTQPVTVHAALLRKTRDTAEPAWNE
jgi:hypothetical protein